MDDLELSNQIRACNADYTAASGKSCEHFYCPILLKDDKAEMIRGHIVNEPLKSSNEWVPQRKDVDGFFGSVVEPEFIQIIQDRERDPLEIWFEKGLRKKHRPKLMIDGETIDHYFPKNSQHLVPGHTGLIVTDNKENPICKLALKVPPERLIEAKEGQIELVVERDYRPSVIAALLKSAHLTLFKIMGYQHVLSATGLLLADILRQFFCEHDGKHGVSEKKVERYFLRYESMVTPLIVENDAWLRGTIEDNTFLTLLTMSDQVFALGVIVRGGPDRFCVFLPTDCGKTVNTYFDFLRVPPVSVRAEAMRFRPPKDGDIGAWEADVNDIRIPMRHQMPERPKRNSTLLVIQ
jgi:hypothetical protein